MLQLSHPDSCGACSTHPLQAQALHQGAQWAPAVSALAVNKVHSLAEQVTPCLDPMTLAGKTVARVTKSKTLSSPKPCLLGLSRRCARPYTEAWAAASYQTLAKPVRIPQQRSCASIPLHHLYRSVTSGSREPYKLAQGCRWSSLGAPCWCRRWALICSRLCKSICAAQVSSISGTIHAG